MDTAITRNCPFRLLNNNNNNNGPVSPCSARSLFPPDRRTRIARTTPSPYRMRARHVASRRDLRADLPRGTTVDGVKRRAPRPVVVVRTPRRYAVRKAVRALPRPQHASFRRSEPPRARAVSDDAHGDVTWKDARVAVYVRAPCCCRKYPPTYRIRHNTRAMAQ